MSVSRRIREYLDAAGVRYAWLPDAEALAAEHAPLTQTGRGRHFAKVLVLRNGKKKMMLILSASQEVDMPTIKRHVKASHLEHVPEATLNELCSGCEPSAFPPFGHLYNMDVWVDSGLAQSPELVFHVGSRADGIRLRYSEYADLVNPHVANFTARHLVKAA